MHNSPNFPGSRLLAEVERGPGQRVLHPQGHRPSPNSRAYCGDSSNSCSAATAHYQIHLPFASSRAPSHWQDCLHHGNELTVVIITTTVVAYAQTFTVIINIK